jgi:hypothetical protein
MSPLPYGLKQRQPPAPTQAPPTAPRLRPVRTAAAAAGWRTSGGASDAPRAAQQMATATTRRAGAAGPSHGIFIMNFGAGPSASGNPPCWLPQGIHAGVWPAAGCSRALPHAASTPVSPPGAKPSLATSRGRRKPRLTNSAGPRFAPLQLPGANAPGVTQGRPAPGSFCPPAPSAQTRPRCSAASCCRARASACGSATGSFAPAASARRTETRARPSASRWRRRRAAAGRSSLMGCFQVCTPAAANKRGAMLAGALRASIWRLTGAHNGDPRGSALHCPAPASPPSHALAFRHSCAGDDTRPSSAQTCPQTTAWRAALWSGSEGSAWKAGRRGRGSRGRKPCRCEPSAGARWARQRGRWADTG